MVASGIATSKKGILRLQNMEIVLFIISDLLVFGYSGAIMNFVSLIRNILVEKGVYNKLSALIIIIISTILVLLFDHMGIVGFLPLAAMYLYALFMNTENIKKFKLLMIIVMFLWAIYDMAISLYVSVFFDIFTIMSCLVSLLMMDGWKVYGNRRNKRINIK